MVTRIECMHGRWRRPVTTTVTGTCLPRPVRELIESLALPRGYKSTSMSYFDCWFSLIIHLRQICSKIWVTMAKPIHRSIMRIVHFIHQCNLFMKPFMVLLFRISSSVFKQTKNSEKVSNVSI